MKYDYAKIIKVVEEQNLAMNWELAEEFEKGCLELKFSQPQFEYAVVSHAMVVNSLFTPKEYSWKSRLLIALFFLGLVRRREV